MITIVSGLPRTGTSMMMQMLYAGGAKVLTDFERKADIDNPRGYYEWESAKLLSAHPNRIDEAEGKVVKVISQLLLSVPKGRRYRVIFMERSLPELLASQMQMLRHRGRSDSVSYHLMAAAFEEHLTEVNVWLKTRADISLYRLEYTRVLQQPFLCSVAVRDFLAFDLNVEAMSRQVDPALYRNRHSCSLL